MNQNIVKMEYAVRGILPIRAMELARELKQGVKKPFDSIIFANIGDPHAMGQQPTTFFRQVVACCDYPELMNYNVFPNDVKRRASKLLSGIGGGGIGSYSDSQGPLKLREDVAQSISDGKHDCNPDDIFLCAGATDGIKSVLHLIDFGQGKDRTGVLTPIPQYPLYSATLTEMNLVQIKYYLDEDNAWAINVDSVHSIVQKAREKCTPRALVVINPGNPTGQCFSRRNVEDIVRYCSKEGLIIIADEVYQENIYAKGMQFHSFRKVANDIGLGPNDITIASFYSASKGYMGECGYRAGFMELYGLDPVVKNQFRKHRTANLCSSNAGQVIMNCIVNPPKPGDESYELFAKERENVLMSLTDKASKVSEAFNSIKGVKCNRIDGAMYAFPSITLPKRAIEAANSAKMAPDTFFCLDFLENTGICVVPGSGFGQREGTYHFRTTILPDTEKMQRFLVAFEDFYKKFVAKYTD
ncbi:uncharacterized protein TRIADDRAFT_50189 [Trichoplax adhaerens]|uniref:alanine transaminase n=1 Tax=Trichoplax adhaerens TaxID=10228 RepID=B3RVC4_TRIAD|nr:hypothetical protein TRIADDRAFT_50189 [Trichoplax adhaerens]EDV25969.1 hypothetical protein TRIADDRAFT_50189 [Trichoplax adhaerens]|eukprot:XP_002112002.1 hypothetical protein TRIADDRAFT_50189 [Trichoplax adhaerens]